MSRPEGVLFDVASVGIRPDHYGVDDGDNPQDLRMPCERTDDLGTTYEGTVPKILLRNNISIH